MEESLRQFGRGVDALIKGQSLSRSEAREMFRQVILNEQPDLQQGAFLAAITAKGANPEDIAGIWEAISRDTVKARPIVDGPLARTAVPEWIP
jgi:anthranilate phosphoribosyltransferase